MNWYQSGKRSKSGQNLGGVPVHVQGCTDTGHQRPTCTGTCPTCVGTCQQNATCTGTGPGCTGTGPGCTGTGPGCTGIGPGCTGTCEPKMPRMLCFCVIKPEFVHR